jgi:hypothetical protein
MTPVTKNSGHANRSSHARCYLYSLRMGRISPIRVVHSPNLVMVCSFASAWVEDKDAILAAPIEIEHVVDWAGDSIE